MKLFVLLLTTSALTVSAASAAQLREEDQAAGTVDGFTAALAAGLAQDIYDEDALLAGDEASIQLAARIVRRGPAGAVIVGPRGRTFLYRGRPLAVVRRPVFIYPPGYVYRRWAVGALLPVALIATPFLFMEWQAAGLRPPPPEHHWVRHGPDLLLVNDRTHRVEEVVYGAIEEE